MTYPVITLPAADDDVDEVANFLAERNQTLDKALDFYDAVAAAEQDLAEHPGHWPLSRHRAEGDMTLRHRRLPGFPNHLLFYRFDGDRVMIVRVLHAARDLPAFFAPG